MDLDLVSHRQTAVSNTVKVENTLSIRNWVLEGKVNPLLKAKNIGAVLDKLEPVANSLAPYGDVSYFLDLKKPYKKGMPLNLLTTIKISEAVAKEPLKVGVYTGTDLNGLNFNYFARNKFGLGDSVNLSAAVQPSPYGLGSGSLDFEVPVPFPLVYNSFLGARVFFLNQERPWASHSVESHGISAYLKFPTSNCFQTKFGVEAVARQIPSLGDGCSDTVRAAAANPATKVSAIASVIAGPLKIEGEAAGKPGDSVFQKVTASAKIARELFAPLSVELNGNAGYIAGKSSILDQFLLGGPRSVYGFKINSIGPKDGQDFVGAQSFYQGSFTLSSWLPWCPKSPLRLVGSINGAAAQLNKSENVVKNLNSLAELSPSVAASAGLSYRSNAANFDLLYLHPIHAGPGDIVRTGVYLGVNLNFA